jgi:predicted RNase H-like nuclease
MWVAGADGCAEGWVVVFRSTAGRPPKAVIFGSIASALGAPEQPKVVAIDIPIGLPKKSETGGRLADREARKELKLRKSSIFPAPSRPVLRARSFQEAKDLELENSTPAKALGMQVFNILRKIREVDDIASKRTGRIFECHPEMSFWAMNGRAEMIAPKRKSRGFAERCNILSQHGFDRAFLTARIGSARNYNRDDLADACAAAWTAERILKGTAFRFPMEATSPDCRGIDMAIWA